MKGVTVPSAMEIVSITWSFTEAEEDKVLGRVSLLLSVPAFDFFDGERDVPAFSLMLWLNGSFSDRFCSALLLLLRLRQIQHPRKEAIVPMMTTERTAATMGTTAL